MIFEPADGIGIKVLRIMIKMLNFLIFFCVSSCLINLVNNSKPVYFGKNFYNIKNIMYKLSISMKNISAIIWIV